MNLPMSIHFQILALFDNGNPNVGGGFLDSLRGPLLIVAIALGLALIIAMVILAMHRDGGKRSKQSRGARLTTSKPVAPGEEGTRRKKRRHKRRRRDHRKRNPTLSETGGLPPRESGQPEPGDDKPDQ